MASEKEADNAPLLRGKWYNELGSMMFIERVHSDGVFHGWYETAVGRQTGVKFPLVGKISTSQTNPTFGFTVVWKESTTTWVGQFFDRNGEQTLLTTWILRNDNTYEDDWESTLIGKDQFKRTESPKK
ncbi:avidin-like [Amphiura filiformis]|uniref:avidin-like n=1 Tax=Amphiura filiformis TaxID=82378 RepID=UPI003B21081F